MHCAVFPPTFVPKQLNFLSVYGPKKTLKLGSSKYYYIHNDSLQFSAVISTLVMKCASRFKILCFDSWNLTKHEMNQ